VLGVQIGREKTLMLKTFLQAATGVAMTFATTAKASAGCVLFLCLPIIPGSGGATDHAPEIDPVQGVAAVTVLVCVGLIMREKFRAKSVKA
jgi:hypothetical protein